MKSPKSKSFTPCMQHVLFQTSKDRKCKKLKKSFVGFSCAWEGFVALRPQWLAVNSMQIHASTVTVGARKRNAASLFWPCKLPLLLIYINCGVVQLDDCLTDNIVW